MEMIRSDTGRAGARTSILTEDQAVEVFLLRPAQRTDRAWLCAQLAERYHVTSTTIPAGLSTEIKLTSEAALPEVVGGFTVERVTATSASVGVDQAELLQQLTDLLDQYAMTPLGLHCLLQIYLARAEGAK